MEEKTVTLKNAYYRNVLYVIEELLLGIPRPAYVEEKPGRSLTEFFFQEPIRNEDFEKQSGIIAINYSKTTRTEFAAMAGIQLERDPIVFECHQDRENNQVLVNGYCSTHRECKDWIQPVFENIWQKLLERFSD